MSTVSTTTDSTLMLGDVTVIELDLPRPDMAGLDPHTQELFVARGMTTPQRVELLDRLQRLAKPEEAAS